MRLFDVVSIVHLSVFNFITIVTVYGCSKWSGNAHSLCRVCSNIQRPHIHPCIVVLSKQVRFEDAACKIIVLT